MAREISQRQKKIAGNTCCYKPDLITKVVETRVSVETVEKETIAVCANCDTVKEVMETEKVPYGG